MAAVVAGPSMLALDAICKDFLSSPTTFPVPSTTARCTATCSAANANTVDALVTTSTTLSLAPTTVKNFYIRISAMVSPLGASAPNTPGNVLARSTTSEDTHGCQVICWSMRESCSLQDAMPSVLLCVVLARGGGDPLSSQGNCMSRNSRCSRDCGGENVKLPCWLASIIEQLLVWSYGACLPPLSLVYLC